MTRSAGSLLSFLWISVYVLLVPFPALADQDRKHVMATIKPLQLLVKAIAGDVVQVDVLLAPQQSPHNYQLRPSDRRKLAEAAKIYWIGPSMETFLARSVESMPQERIETLGKIADPVDHDEHSHTSLEDDPHLWIDFSQVIAMSGDIEKSLSRLLPEYSQAFARNRAEFLLQMNAIDHQLKKDFAGISRQGLVLSHASYGRLLAHYGLLDNIALSDMHGRNASVKQWQRIEVYMKDKSPHCFLFDPSEPNSMQDTFLQRYKITVIEADPMANSTEVTTSGFVEFYRQLTNNILGCMKAGVE